MGMIQKDFPGVILKNPEWKTSTPSAEVPAASGNSAVWLPEQQFSAPVAGETQGRVKRSVRQPLWETVWQLFLVELNLQRPRDPALTLLGTYPRKMKA